MAASTDTARESIRVVVDVLGYLRDVVGTKQLKVVLDKPTIAGLVDRMSEDHGDEFRNLVVDAGSGDLRVCILVNGKDVDFLQKSNTKLRNGDKIAMIPLAAGGGFDSDYPHGNHLVSGRRDTWHCYSRSRTHKHPITRCPYPSYDRPFEGRGKNQT